MFGLGRRRPQERMGYELYGAAVAAAREPFLYATLGVPDTLDGRFDLVGVYAFLVIDRLRHSPPPGEALAQAQAVFDAMFNDMDVNLREMGVGDLSVGRKVKVMWEAFHGRARAYTEALERGAEGALEAVLARNVWRGVPPGEGPARLARVVRAQAAALAEQDLCAGAVRFRPAAEVA